MARNFPLIYPPYTMILEKLPVDYGQLQYTQAFSHVRNWEDSNGLPHSLYAILEIPDYYYYTLMQIRAYSPDFAGRADIGQMNIEAWQISRGERAVTDRAIPLQLVTPYWSNAYWYNVAMRQYYFTADKIKIKISNIPAGICKKLTVMTLGNRTPNKKA